MEQQTPEWQRARLGVATGSIFKALLSNGEARKTCINTLIAESLTGEWTEVSAKSLDWGNHYEKEAGESYQFLTGYEVEKVGIVFHNEHPRVAVSPDGLIDTDGGIEIKCPATSKEHIKHIRYGLPANYKPQVQGCIWVADRDWWDFVSYDPRMPIDLQLHVVRIQRDEKYIENLSERVLSAVDEVESVLAKLDAH